MDETQKNLATGAVLGAGATLLALAGWKLWSRARIRPKCNTVHNTKKDKPAPVVVSPAEWLTRRVELLQKEKDVTRYNDELAAARQRLPMERVTNEYQFESKDGPISLRQLFGDKKELIVYHFMFEPEWKEGCPGCTLWCDGFNGFLRHITQRCAFAVVAKAPASKLKSYAKDRKWKFTFVSSGKTTFNKDFGVEFSQAEVDSKKNVFNYNSTTAWSTQDPGISVFYKADDDTVYHTYSTYARGMDAFNSAYALFDRLPFGRDGFQPGSPPGVNKPKN
jgi:predicted dithiol-disulfide oxidoreductase (DUF899 family)